MQTSLSYRTNRDVFSNHYLDNHLPETEEWNEVSDEELQDAYEAISDLWEQERDPNPKQIGSQLEETFIRPVFRRLGIPFQAEESTSRTQHRPDYGFFETEGVARDAFQRREADGEFYEGAVAIADARRWGRSLDTRGSGEHVRGFENPSYRIHVHLQETSARWAVLTNGTKWRLYYGPTSHRLDSYYEIDLPVLLETGDLEDFKRFYLFFRHEAFLEDASGDSFLDDVYDESTVVAQELGADLQDNICEAIEILSEDVLQSPETDLDEDDLGLIYDASLTYLYRIIFVLYAEAEGRDLLNTDNEIYERSYSLNSLKQRVAEELDSGNPNCREWQDTLQSRLDDLFVLIDQGSKSRGIPEEELYIPAYNGRLFRTDPDEDDSRQAQLLAEHDVGAASLAKVVDLLTRCKTSNTGDKTFVDYSSLGVRHLGSIYEGLLEHQLNVANEPLALEDGAYVRADTSDDVVVQEGGVYLTTDSGERKATGSYYTPEYVVEYIVETTLEPLVADIRMDLAERSAFGERGFATEFADQVFDLSILDPALGSGHFLTSAVDYLAREIIDAQEKQAAQKGVETVDREHDINWARRKVAQHCIYGVDRNPLAVELAKVSLWLRTFVAGQPLAFLDHHLKTGNSLVGSDLQDVLGKDGPPTDSGQRTFQQSLSHTRQQAIEYVMDRIQNLRSIDDETFQYSRKVEAMYDEVGDDSLYQNLLSMANVHTAEEFGLDVPSDADERMAEALRDGSWDGVENQDWFRSAQLMADETGFFHWELEFPVAFYNADGERKDDSGFDAVLGNPPYLAFQEGNEFEREYYREQYETAHRNYDIYVLFVEKSIELANDHSGWIGLIIPNKFISSQYGEKLKGYIIENTQVESLLDFGDGVVFEDAKNYVCIPILHTGANTEPTKYMRNTDPTEAIQTALSDAGWETVPGAALNDWNFMGDGVYPILEKIDAHHQLSELSETIFQGARPGGEKVYSEVESEEVEEELLKPFIKAEDVDSYYVSEDDKRIIFPYVNAGMEYELVRLCEYPNTEKYLSENKSEIYESQSPHSGIEYGYYHVPRHLEDKDLILFPDISEDSKFSLNRADTPVFPNTVYAIKLNQIKESEEYIVAVLNSTLLEAKLKSLSTSVKGGYYRYKTEYLERLPIKRIEHPSTGGDIEDLTREYEQYLTGNSSIDDIRSAIDTESAAHSILTELVEARSEMQHDLETLDHSLFDHLGTGADGPTLSDVGHVRPVSSTILTSTTTEYEKLRIGAVKTNRDDHGITVRATARYKPEDEDEFETDRWGYTETDYIEGFTLTDLTEKEAVLVEEFLPIAVDEESGGFIEEARKSISPVDRLKDVTFPDPEDTAEDLNQYLETKERAKDLEERIEQTDRLVDAIVYDLYGLTDEEIEIIESAIED